MPRENKNHSWSFIISPACLQYTSLRGAYQRSNGGWDRLHSAQIKVDQTTNNEFAEGFVEKREFIFFVLRAAKGIVNFEK